jgi:predicted transcriptional regulator
MTTITIVLEDEPMSRLKQLADQAGLTPEEMLRVSAERWLGAPKDDFAAAAAYVLKKNAELYRRLA